MNLILKMICLDLSYNDDDGSETFMYQVDSASYAIHRDGDHFQGKLFQMWGAYT